MPRNGSGSYQLPAGNPVTPSTLIRSEWANTTFNDVAQALTASISKDGQTTPTANLPMGGFKHTNVGSATSVGQYATAEQVQNGSLFVLITNPASVASAYLADTNLGTVNFAVGTILQFTPNVANTAGAVITIGQSGGGVAAPIQGYDGTPVTAGALQPGTTYSLRAVAGAWRLEAQVTDFVLKVGDVMTGDLVLHGTTTTRYTAWVNINQAKGVRVGVGTSGTSFIDVLPMDNDGVALPATPSGALVLRFQNPAGTFITGQSWTNYGVTTATGVVPKQYANPIIVGLTTLSFNDHGQTYNVSMSGNSTMNITDVPVGAILRVVVQGTGSGTFGMLVNSVTPVWPNGVTPNFAAGPLKIAVLTFHVYTAGGVIAAAVTY
jgi:hypothetical protein